MNMSECNSYEEQCKKWHNELLNEFMDNNTMNLKERLNEIEDIVNEECSQYVSSLNHYNIGINLFKITEPERNNLLDLYNANLREHTVVSYEKCTKQMNNRDDYKKKARNKLNRWKPKVYGDNVLYQIIFINMYNYCYTIGRNHEWDDNEILYLFITIFIKLLTSKIRFKKTRDVPLILSTAFSTNTKFRSSCIYFLQHFNELKSWDDKSGRAKDKCDSFKKCLEKLKNIQYSIVIPPPIICDYMDIQENNRTCKGGYQYLIGEIIVKLEDEENCNKDERISECGALIEIINEYHHYNIKFWTVTPEKPSRLLYKYSTYNDNDYNINRYDNDSNDDDGDFAIICGKDDIPQIPPPIGSGIINTGIISNDIYSNSYNLYGNNNNNNNEQQQLPEIDLSMTIGSTSGNSCDFSVASHTTYTSTKSGNNNNNYNAVNRPIFNNSHTLNNNPTLNNNHTFNNNRTFNNNHSFNSNGNNFSLGYKANRGSPNYCRDGISHDPLYAPQAVKLKQQQRQKPRFSRVSSRDSIPNVDKIPPINDGQYVYNNCGPEMELISNNNYIQATIQRNPPITQQLPRPTRQFIINDNFQERYNNCIGNNGGYRNNYNNDNHYQSRNPPLSRELPIPHTFVNYNINNNNNRNNNNYIKSNNMLVTNNTAINFNLSNSKRNVNQQQLNNMCQLASVYNGNVSNTNNNSNNNQYCHNNHNNRPFENTQQFIYCDGNNINSNNNDNQEMQFDEYNIDSNQYSQFNEDNDCNQFIMTQEMQMDPRSNNIRYFVNNHSMNNHNMNNHNMNNSNYGQYGNNR